MKVQPVGHIRGITIKNVTAVSHSKMASSITAFPGQYIENVTLENVKISTMGYGTLEEANTPLPENSKAYPENRMYGQVYPASGLFLRHIKGMTLKEVDLTVRNPDFRPEIIFDDVFDSRVLNK